MVKTQGQTKGRTKGQTGPKRAAAGKRRKPAGFYERNSRLLWTGALALTGFLIFAVALANKDKDPEAGRAGFTGGDFHSMVVDPGRPNRIFVGGHEAVSVSTDGGKTFRQIPSLDNRDAMGWGFDGSYIFVGGHPGLSVSTDGGKTFKESNDGLVSTDLHAFGAGGGAAYAASPQAGFTTSANQGASWEVVNSRRGSSFFGRMLVDRKGPQHVVTADSAAGVVESRDGGKSWSTLGGLQSATWVSWDPEDTLHIVASGQSGTSESIDGGKSWKPMAVPKGSTIVELDPHNAGFLYAGSHEDQGVRVSISRDGGRTWNPA